MPPATELRHTPLTAAHEAADARLVDFSGFLMPVQYQGILEEARHVRANVGLFDLCHMGRVRFTGPQREQAAQFLVHVNVSKLKLGAIRYSMFCREDGTTMDDVLVYRDADEIFFCINAGNRDRDVAWMKEVAARFDVQFEDLSDELAMIAIQGRHSTTTLAPLCTGGPDEAVRKPTPDGPPGIDGPGPGALKYYSFYRGTVCDTPAMISRTGYTGEDGYEIYFAASEAMRVWNALLESGAACGAMPIGLGARDTLRLEAGMALYGHELDDTTNPVEAGVIVKPIKHPHDFSGRAAIEATVASGPTRRLVGFTTDSPRVPRQGYSLHAGDEQVGSVCSGSPSPMLDTHIGTAYVTTGHHEAGGRLEMDIRGKRHPVTIVDLPFYKRDY